jgi:tetratricopeptide (TPR) repeat protein
MPEKEGILFLLKRAGCLAVDASLDAAHPQDVEAARAIVSAVGGLPLALDQAGAYVAETKRGLSDYLDLFKQRQTALLKRRGTLSHDHPQSVTATFSLAIGQVQQKNEAAIDLLKLCAYLAPDAIPLEVISEGAAHLGTILEPVAVDILHLDQALETLQAYSLVQRDPKRKTLSIHRLVQAVLRDGMDEVTSKLWIERAVQAVNAALPSVEHKNWPQWERLLAQTQQCAQWIEHYDLFIEEAVLLLEETGWYIAERARYKEAEPLLERALKISEHVQGSEHLDTARAAGTLGWLYEKQGRYEQAEPLYQRALAIREQQLGVEHPDTAISLDNLADLYENQGKYSEAEPLYRRALQIFEQQLGAEHPYTAASLGNLARIYRSWGKYSEAELLLQRALQIDEQQSGAEHPYTASSLNNLALLYESQGKYSEAEPLYQRALTIREQVLGPEHPETAEVVHGLARLREAQGNSEEARIWYARALAIHEQTLGAHHPETTKTRNRFIALLHALGQHEEAAQLDAAHAEQGTSEEKGKIHSSEE